LGFTNITSIFLFLYKLRVRYFAQDVKKCSQGAPNAYMLADNCQKRLRDLLHLLDDVSKRSPIHILKHNRNDSIVVKGMVTHHHIRKLGFSAPALFASVLFHGCSFESPAHMTNNSTSTKIQ
jgi:hypothetical protein